MYVLLDGQKRCASGNQRRYGGRGFNPGRDLRTDAGGIGSIDGDLRRPSLAALLGVEHEVGFSNLLNGSVRLDDAVVALATPNLFLLASGPVPPDPADLIGRAQARGTIEQLSESFDTVIVKPIRFPAATVAWSAVFVSDSIGPEAARAGPENDRNAASTNARRPNSTQPRRMTRRTYSYGEAECNRSS